MALFCRNSLRVNEINKNEIRQKRARHPRGVPIYTFVPHIGHRCNERGISNPHSFNSDAFVKISSVEPFAATSPSLMTMVLSQVSITISKS